ncbi:phage tail protein [Paraburkholderia tropica]|uniref:Minor tail protein Z (GPZ) n=1 Tax=Paraburkholderia tropica TaxID=92647 RepID=A0ABX5MID0_9BURK|nr:phage tail protein [Paraburkholderia tropica]PXX10765.1 minor tail protein Z (GPZ) [Paraburkholderia tropica]PZW75733.1 minor tail protein Z (GPZ) [Paraburkholderia tropica]
MPDAGISVSAITRSVTASAARRGDVSPKDELRAIARALNKVAAQARNEASREVRALGYNMRASAIKKSFRVHGASRNKLAVSLVATGAPIPIINYGARQTAKGVTVRVKNGRKLLPHAFIATMQSGHRGVFQRVGRAHRKVKKEGRKAYMSGLPIRELYGPAIPDALGNDAVEKAMARIIEQKYPRILEYELSRMAK